MKRITVVIVHCVRNIKQSRLWEQAESRELKLPVCSHFKNYEGEAVFVKVALLVQESVTWNPRSYELTIIPLLINSWVVCPCKC